MIHDVLLAFWFMLPAAAANAAPIFSARLPLLRAWDTPLDFGREFRGHPLFGPHKTWRGLLTGTIVATVILWLQQLLVSSVPWAEVFTGNIDYPTLPTLLLGPLFGLGALGGDAVESFLKRRRGTESGGSWVPFDQLDYIIGAVLVTLPFVILTVRQYVLIIVIWSAMHLLSTYIGWKLGLKERPI